jgi:hypothetical protein
MTRCLRPHDMDIGLVVEGLIDRIAERDISEGQFAQVVTSD